jgi:hypothetical protein
MNDEHIQRIRRLSLSLHLKSPMRWKPWLPRDPSAAFICCIGAGPWRYGRRRTIQLHGLTKLAGRDISDLSGREKWFPLNWQNEMLNMLTRSMRRMEIFDPPTPKTTMQALVDLVRHTKSYSLLYAACGRPQGTKVLSLYKRDYIGVPAFPVDRHVRRTLQGLGLPMKEQDLLELFEQAGVDPTPVARMLGTDRLDGGNPDWSKWPDHAAPEVI